MKQLYNRILEKGEGFANRVAQQRIVFEIANRKEGIAIMKRFKLQHEAGGHRLYNPTYPKFNAGLLGNTIIVIRIPLGSKYYGRIKP